MTDDEIDSLWLYRKNTHNGELLPQLRDFARAVLAAPLDKGASKPAAQDDALNAVAADIASMTADELRTVHESHRNGDIAVALRELSAAPSVAQDERGPDFADGPDSEGFNGPRPWNGFQDERRAYEEAFRRNFEFPENADQATFRKGWEAGIIQARAVSPSANVAQSAEPIYQERAKDTLCYGEAWRDVSKEEFDAANRTSSYETRIVYTAPPAQIALTDDARKGCENFPCRPCVSRDECPL